MLRNLKKFWAKRSVLPASKWTKQLLESLCWWLSWWACSQYIDIHHTQDNCMLTPWENLESTKCLLTELTLKAGGHFKADSMFLIKKWTYCKKSCLCLCGRVEAGSGKNRCTLFFSWRNPVYGSSACGIIVRLGDLEGKSIWCRAGELQCQILAG